MPRTTPNPNMEKKFDVGDTIKVEGESLVIKHVSPYELILTPAPAKKESKAA